MLKQPHNLKILVCTPHNYGDIVGGRDKNFEVLRLFEHRYCNTLYDMFNMVNMVNIEQLVTNICLSYVYLFQ